MKKTIYMLLMLPLLAACSSGNSAFTRSGAMRHGEFTVSPIRKVCFSRGNLQYNPYQRQWRFAEAQYDYYGEGNHYIGETYNSWIDLFGWGTGNTPTKAGARNSASWNGVDNDFAHYIDWGDNAISNGGNECGKWRTLSGEEWTYLLSMRKNATSLYASATVNGVTGLIILPDDWIAPEGLVFRSGMHSWGLNVYTGEPWARMEATGAVFLPAAGYRDETDAMGMGEYGTYWSSTGSSTGEAGHMYFRATQLYPQDFYLRRLGRAVRLVRDVK